MDKTLIIPKENNKKLLVVHSNKLTEARYFLTVGEQRLILLMASMIERTDKDFKEYEIRISDFLKLIDLKGKANYKRIKELTKSLILRYLEIEKENKLIQTTWLSSAVYYKDEGIVKLKFDPELKPYLLQLKSNFTKYYFSTIIHFRSAYTIRIYQFLKEHEYIGFADVYYQDFRERLGIKFGEYKEYKQFKQWVINQAKKELEERISKNGAYKSDLSFNLEVLERKNRKIYKIRFNIVKQNYQEALPLNIPESEPPKPIILEKPKSPPLVMLLSHGLSEPIAEKYLKNNKEENILDTIKLYEKKISDGEAKSLGGSYLIKLLEAKAGQKTEYEKQLEETEKQAIIEAKREAEKKEKENKILDDYFKNLSESEQENIVQELVCSLGDFEKSFYHKKGLAHPVVSFKLKKLLQQKIAENKTKEAPKESTFNNSKVKAGKLAQKELDRLNLVDLEGQVPTMTTKSKKVYPVKYLYKNKEGLMSWHGKGRKPKWLIEYQNEGGKLADILITIKE